MRKKINGRQKGIVKLLILIMIIFGLNLETTAQRLGLDSTFNSNVTDSAAQNFVSAAQSDGKVLVGGTFSFVNGSQIGSLARLNADGTVDIGFNTGGSGPNAPIVCILVLSDGKIVIGGSFTSYNGTAVGRLARLNSNGTLDTTFNVGGSGISGSELKGLALQPDGKIICVGRQITGYNGNTSNGVFRINADGSFDNTFVSGFTTSPFLEHTAVQADGKILIAGIFTSYGGNASTGLIRVTSSGAFDFSFPIDNSGSSIGITGVAIQADGKIVFCGTFGNYNGTPRTNIARVNANGTLDTSFVPPTFPELDFIEFVSIQTDGKVVAAGNINISGVRYALIRLNSDGSLDNSLLNGANSFANHVGLQADGKILLTGDFTRFATGGTRNAITRFNTDGSIDNGFAPSFTRFGLVSAIAQQADGKIVVGGQFQKANGNFSNNIARFNSDGSFDNTFAIGTGPAPDSQFINLVSSITIQPDGKILVGGRFGSFNGVSRTSLVRLNPNGSVDNSFTLTGNIVFNISFVVEDILVLPDGKILIGGNMRDFTSFSTTGLLRLNSDGSIDTSFNSGTSANNTVLRILRQPDGKYLIGGAFTTYNGTPRQRIARVNTDGTLDTTFNAVAGAINSTVADLALQPDGKVIIGGFFTTLFGNPQNRISRLNADGTFDNSFNIGTGANNSISAIILQPTGKIFVGGVFINYNGTPQNRLGRLNTNGSLDTGYVSGFDNVLGSVQSLFIQSDGKILVGGTFTNYNGVPRNNLLRLASLRAPLDFDGDGISDIGVYRQGQWYIQQSTLGFRSQSFGLSADIPTTADFDGDQKADIAVWRSAPATQAAFYIFQSSNNTVRTELFGQTGDNPALVADYDGDGKADPAVYREGSQSFFYYRGSLNNPNGNTTYISWGITGDSPVSGDYNGDGKNDFAIYRNGQWWVLQNGTANVEVRNWGISGDKLVQSDYDGDGKTDLAVFRPSDGTWYILQSSNNQPKSQQWGLSSDVLVPADYDGDGKTDTAIYRNGIWYILQSANSSIQYANFGLSADTPLASVFVQ